MSESPSRPPSTPKRSLLSLLADVPMLFGNLIREEIAQLKAEVVGKIKHAGIGIGLLAGAAVFALFALGVLVAAAVLGIAEALPGWLAALIVAAFLLIVAVVVGLIGWRVLKKGLPPVPQESLRSLRSDLRTVRGLGKRGAA